MATNTKVIFPQTPYCKNVLIEAKDTDYVLHTAGASGAKVSKIMIKFFAGGTSVASLLRIYVKDDGGTARLIDEVVIAAVVGSATVASAYYEKLFDDFQLSPLQVLSVQVSDISGAAIKNAIAFAMIGEYLAE